MITIKIAITTNITISPEQHLPKLFVVTVVLELESKSDPFE